MYNFKLVGSRIMFLPLLMFVYLFQVFKDPELEGFFAQLGTYQILMDLLFQNEKYEDMLDVFEIIKQRQHQEAKFPKNVVVLTFAACFKLVSTSSSVVIIILWCCCCPRGFCNRILCLSVLPITAVYTTNHAICSPSRRIAVLYCNFIYFTLTLSVLCPSIFLSIILLFFSVLGTEKY
jgi:pentatricopeptide repeat protein